MESQHVQQGEGKSHVNLTEHGVCPAVQRVFLLQVQFAYHQVYNYNKVWDEDSCLCGVHSIIEEAEEQGNAAQYADVAVHVDSFVSVHQIAELSGCHGADDAEQQPERQWTSDDAAYQHGYEYQSCNGSLDKIFHVVGLGYVILLCFLIRRYLRCRCRARIRLFSCS